MKSSGSHEQGSGGSRRSVADERAAAQAAAAANRAQRRAEIDRAFDGAIPGLWKIRVSWLVATAIPLLGVVSLWRPKSIGIVYFVATFVAFAVGTALCAWAFVVAARRSRDELLELGRLIFGTGIAPTSVVGQLWGATLVQFVAGIVIAIAAAQGAGNVPTTPDAGLNFFFGSMLAMFGCGAQVWWFAAHGAFEPIVQSGASDRTRRAR